MINRITKTEIAEQDKKTPGRNRAPLELFCHAADERFAVLSLTGLFLYEGSESYPYRPPSSNLSP